MEVHHRGEEGTTGGGRARIDPLIDSVELRSAEMIAKVALKGCVRCAE